MPRRRRRASPRSSARARACAAARRRRARRRRRASTASAVSTRALAASVAAVHADSAVVLRQGVGVGRACRPRSSASSSGTSRRTAITSATSARSRAMLPAGPVHDAGALAERGGGGAQPPPRSRVSGGRRRGRRAASRSTAAAAARTRSRWCTGHSSDGGDGGDADADDPARARVPPRSALDSRRHHREHERERRGGGRPPRSSRRARPRTRCANATTSVTRTAGHTVSAKARAERDEERADHQRGRGRRRSDGGARRRSRRTPARRTTRRRRTAPRAMFPAVTTRRRTASGTTTVARAALRRLTRAGSTNTRRIVDDAGTGGSYRPRPGGPCRLGADRDRDPTRLTPWPSRRCAGSRRSTASTLRGAADPNPVLASSMLINGYVEHHKVGWDFDDESPGRDARGFAREGAHAARGRDAPRQHRAHQRRALLRRPRAPRVLHARVRRRARARAAPTRRGSGSSPGRCWRPAACSSPGQEIVVYKNNSDGKGNSYGTHENYLVDREVPFAALVRNLLPWFVSRQVFTGAGKVGTENGAGAGRLPDQPARRLLRGGGRARDHAEAPDRQHARRAARRSAEVPAPARDRRATPTCARSRRS